MDSSSRFLSKLSITRKIDKLCFENGMMNLKAHILHENILL